MKSGNVVPHRKDVNLKRIFLILIFRQTKGNILTYLSARWRREGSAAGSGMNTVVMSGDALPLPDTIRFGNVINIDHPLL